MDRQELERKFEKYADTVYRVCMTYLGSFADCEDAVQEVFLRMIDKQPEFHSESEEKGWLIVTACNWCKSQLRRRKRHPQVSPENTPEQPVWDSSDAEILELIQSLPENCRQVVFMHCCEGYTLAEIAKLCGMNASTVRSRWFYARKKLKKQLGGSEDE